MFINSKYRFQKQKNAKIKVSSNSSTQTHQLFNHIGLQCLIKNPGRSRLLRETLKMFFGYSWTNLFKIYETDSNRPAYVFRGLYIWNYNFPIFKTQGGVGFLRQNITLFWSSLLIGWAMSDFQSYCRMWDFSSHTVIHL